MAKRRKHISSLMTDEEWAQTELIQEGAQPDVPPKTVQPEPRPNGRSQWIHQARRLGCMTRYGRGQTAHVPATIVRAIEKGYRWGTGRLSHSDFRAL